MAGAGIYKDDKGLDSFLAASRYEEVQFYKKCVKDLIKRFKIGYADALDELTHSLQMKKFFDWQPVETVVVIGIGEGIESEFAFQRKCPSIVYRCYIYNTPT